MTTLNAALPGDAFTGSLPYPTRTPVAALFIGSLLAIAIATAGLLAWPDHESAQAPPLPGASLAAATTIQASDVTMAAVTYDPGQSSGWHAHPGIHAIAITGGTLTVYDAGCVRHTFGPGETYVGGHDVHLARNETALPVEMIVTIIEPGVPANSVARQATPLACGQPELRVTE